MGPGFRLTVALVACLHGCGGGGGADPDGGTVADSGADAPDGDLPPLTLTFVAPEVGMSLLGSAAVELAAGSGIDAVEVDVAGETTPRCELAARPFVCLVDLASLPAGPFELSARGYAAGVEVADAAVALERRAPGADPCPDATAPADCVTALVTAGSAAGYSGLSYHCMDDGHAQVDTSGMPGIEIQVNQVFAGQDPWHTDPDRIVVGNQSEAFNYADGWESIPRGLGIANLSALWETSKLFLWPEHRDHGYIDYYAWQSPTLVLSQGSSGSELDEVTKLLHLLAALQPTVRARLHDAGLLMPAIVLLHRRARVATDLEYLSAPAHAPAVIDADSDRAGIRLAQAIVDGELPPVARLTVESATIPEAWQTAGFAAQELTAAPYAIVYAPFATPADAPAGTFDAIVDLSASADDAGRHLVFFSRIVRGDPARLRVTQLDATRFRVEAEWPADFAEDVNGQSRTSRRASVAFFAHDGLWPSAPAFLSIHGANPHVHAPDSNNLD